jgi:hypothetical protein
MDLFKPMAVNDGMDFLDKKSSASNDGIYRPNLKNAKDKKKGYRSVIRFLPNLKKDGSLGSNAIEKMLHYVKLPNYDELNGYYDSMKNFGEKCDLTNTYWALKNSNSVVDQEKAELISRTTKYYSYVLIIEDENQPELEGKIMIYNFGYKIKEKIEQERTGEITGTPCNVFDLANGKDFVLILKEVGGYNNYDSSQFKSDTSPMKIKGKDGDMKELPTQEAEGGLLAIHEKVRDKAKEFLLNRDNDLEDYEPVRWDDETREKVNKIVSILTDNPVINAAKSIESSKTQEAAPMDSDFDVTSESSSSGDTDPDAFFDNI